MPLPSVESGEGKGHVGEVCVRLYRTQKTTWRRGMEGWKTDPEAMCGKLEENSHGWGGNRAGSNWRPPHPKCQRRKPDRTVGERTPARDYAGTEDR